MAGNVPSWQNLGPSLETHTSQHPTHTHPPLVSPPDHHHHHPPPHNTHHSPTPTPTTPTNPTQPQHYPTQHNTTHTHPPLASPPDHHHHYPPPHNTHHSPTPTPTTPTNPTQPQCSAPADADPAVLSASIPPHPAARKTGTSGAAVLFSKLWLQPRTRLHKNHGRGDGADRALARRHMAPAAGTVDFPGPDS